jgi:hypothetical protein
LNPSEISKKSKIEAYRKREVVLYMLILAEGAVHPVREGLLLLVQDKVLRPHLT